LRCWIIAFALEELFAGSGHRQDAVGLDQLVGSVAEMKAFLANALAGPHPKQHSTQSTSKGLPGKPFSDKALTQLPSSTPLK